MHASCVEEGGAAAHPAQEESGATRKGKKINMKAFMKWQVKGLFLLHTLLSCWEAVSWWHEAPSSHSSQRNSRLWSSTFYTAFVAAWAFSVIQQISGFYLKHIKKNVIQRVDKEIAGAALTQF